MGFPKTHHWRRLSVITAFLLSGCSGGVLDPRGAIGIEEKNLILIATGLMLLVVIPVIFMSIYFVWRYRADRPDVDRDFRPEWAHSNAIEAGMWILPIVIVSILGYLSWKTTYTLDPYQPIRSTNEPIEVEVVSLDWKWLFIYPKEGIATVNELAFPEKTPVHFKLTSQSVMNAFFIPQLGSQIYTMAGMQTQLNLVANETGDFQGLATNFSGPGFSGMTFRAKSMSPSDYAAWVAKVKAAGGKLDPESYKTLSRPSEHDPVKYYAQVAPGMFDHVLQTSMAPMASMPGAHTPAENHGESIEHTNQKELVQNQTMKHDMQMDNASASTAASAAAHSH